MKIASVIVDVPAKQTDRAFDYLIPERLEHAVVPGVRVNVPFGPRHIQGFVMEVKAESDVKKLKEMTELLDLTPVLNKELLALGHWLTEHALCYKISAFQAMLPAALKAKYEKKVVLTAKTDYDNLQDDTKPLFRGKREVLWQEVVDRNLIQQMKKEADLGLVELVYEVKDRVRKKKVKHISCLIDRPKIEEEIEKLLPQAKGQKLILQYFLEHSGMIELKTLLADLGASQTSVKSLVKKGILSEEMIEVYRDPYESREFKHQEPLVLTAEQEHAIKPILSSIEEDRHEVFLLYGVTGSGKTEIYLQSIQKVLGKGEEAIVLVPEIALTPQMVRRFKERFGDLVAVMHSGLSAGEKYDEWRKIQRREVKVVVGARSAIFAPFENLGIIIIDEEHETSYKQEENPRYHARDVAIHRASTHHCSVVLGSATPSLESFARAQKGVYTLLNLPKRMNEQPLPAVEIVDMREELREGNRTMFSRSLFEMIQDRLEKGEQIVLFLNKRGHSSFVMCRDCGYVMNCPNCEITLTYHRFQERMKCHYCGHEDRVPTTCPECMSEHIRYFGTGTQKVEEELIKLIPDVRIIRMDVDTTGRKGAHEKLLNAFQEGEADILLGTQMIAKGLDFPNITLVGVLSADTMLHLPDFRSSEKTFQLLTQVSGRAGRHELPGEVVIQTYTPEHYSVELAGTQDYDRFYQQEMMMRKIHKYPPFYYLSLVTVNHEELMKAASITEKITKFITSKLSNQAVVLGPVASPIPRIKNRYRYQCLIKYKKEPELKNALKSILDHYQQETASKNLQISIDLNPYILM